LDEAYDRAITAGDADHATEIEQLKISHAEAIAALKKEHAASQENLSSVAEKRKVNDLPFFFRTNPVANIRIRQQKGRHLSKR
jgi:hypothetical protein